MRLRVFDLCFELKPVTARSRQRRDSPDPYRDERNKDSGVAVIRRGGPAVDANTINLKELAINVSPKGLPTFMKKSPIQLHTSQRLANLG